MASNSLPLAPLPIGFNFEKEHSFLFLFEFFQIFDVSNYTKKAYLWKIIEGQFPEASGPNVHGRAHLHLLGSSLKQKNIV